MKSSIWSSAASLMLVAVAVVFSSVQGADAKPVKVLFLGDNGHHVPAVRFKELQPVLQQRGITLEYTDKLDDLNLTKLLQYDVLAIYANFTKLEPDQEKALLEYVSSGHGLVPIHCASACFGNSKAYIELVGGRFSKHGTGVFKETYVMPEHPAIKGLQPIESWDETYVHDRLNNKRLDLATRVDDKGAEPYTWVRDHGKGRVFYTAWGHDQRTWMNAGFQDLIERGIRWAADASSGSELKAKTGLKPFTFKEAEGPIPIYKPDPKWGVQGKNANQIQAPLSPEESHQHFVVPPEFEVQLFASEPQITKPLCLNWDERGRLWISESVDYPNDLQEPGMGNDRIKIVEDTDGDGKADKFTVFADKISIATSIAFANGGAIVMQAPDTVFLKDNDGDNKADVRKNLFSGWGTGDTHAGPSNVHYGFDGWMYGMVGYSGFNGEVGGKKHGFRMGFYRFKSDGSQLEFIRSSNNNTWGYGLTEDNILFGSTANNNASMYMPIANRYYESVQGFAPGVLGTIATSQRFYPITERYRQVDCHANYTAGTGHMIYTARSFPKEYWNKVAFVAEPTGHLVGKFKLVANGADFTAINEKSFAASDDEWAAPIVAEVGPDGALWVIDWYNFIIQHNPTPQGFKTGKRGAYETPLRDKHHGRIYRIVHKGAKPYEPLNLHNATPEKLVATLKHDNMFWRQQAQRLLIERGHKDVLPALYALANDKAVDEIGLNNAALHALWTIQGLGALDGSNADANNVVVAAQKHPAAGVRRGAVMVMPRTEAGLTAILDGKLLDDSDAQVRMATLLAIAEMPVGAGSERAGAAIFDMLKADQNNKDKWIPHAATSAAARHDAAFLKAALGGLKLDPSEAPVAPKVVLPVNAIANPSFEGEANGKPNDWKISNYSGKADYSLANVGRTGGRSVHITSSKGADAGWLTAFKVSPNTEYRLSGWIKTENIKGAAGALFNVHNLQGIKTKALQGTQDWTRVETTFNTQGATEISVNCLFGGWGQSTGSAWFDDVECIALGKSSVPPLPGQVGKTVQTVTGHYARRGATDTVLQLLAALKAADPGLSLPILDGLASGWPQGKSPEINAVESAKLQEILKALPEGARGSLLALTERWGRKDIFANESAEIGKKLSATLTDPKQSAEERADAARRLVILSDSVESTQAILKQITPVSPPVLNTGLIAALGESKIPQTGEEIIAHWKKMTPTAQRAAGNTLMRRTEWTLALLNAVKNNTLGRGDVSADQWQQMKNSTEKEISGFAKKLEKALGGATNADVESLITKLMPLTKETGDAEKGRAVFEKTCAACHTLNGKGGKIGPDLTGFGAHPKPEILVAIVDPNRSVEANFRLWSVKTNDGTLITGRLDSESQTSVEILDNNSLKHQIERQNIKLMKTDNMSIMPEGFGTQLSADDFKHLMEYIAQSKVK